MSYPECEKMQQVKEASQAIGEFLEWLSCRGLIIARHEDERYVCAHCDIVAKNQVSFRGGPHHDCTDGEEREVEHLEEGLYPIYTSTERLLAEYFNIDLAKVEEEKRAMLDLVREREIPRKEPSHEG